MSWSYFANDLIGRVLDVLQPRRKALAELRGGGGPRGSIAPPPPPRWFDLVRDEAPCVDDKTWDDLEFPRLFARLDTTVTPLGSQALYRQLRQCVNDPAELAARHAMHQRLRDDAPLRERLQLALLPLHAPSHAHIAESLFDGEAIAAPRRGWLAAWGALSLLPLIGLLIWNWSAWWWTAALLVNLVLVHRGSWRQMREMEQVNGCLHLLAVADVLAMVREGDAPLPPLARLREVRAERAAAHRALWPLRASKREPVSWVMPWLNLLCLLELTVHQWTVGRFFAQRARLRESFAQVAGLDAAIALASALVMYPRHCQPVIATDAQLDIIDGGHPLLPDGVRNSLRLERSSALVTGSNMAGKTTFVKMLAINVILGRSAGFCLATRAVLPPQRVMAAIHGAHSVAAGKSHYFAEIEAIHGFLDQARQAGGLFVLDEPFSGTNTVERIAIARAVLQALGERSLVLVTTHDVELQALLKGRYALYHFQENPEVEGFFDYRLRPGPATARNAIRLLARVGFPERIVADAMACAAAASPA